MKSFKSVGLGTAEVACGMAYDPFSKALVTSGKTLAMVTQAGKEEIALLKPKEVVSTARPEGSACAYPYLHFASRGDDRVLVSQSGLTLTCLVPSSVKCDLSQTYSSGIHYFEAICPISCSGIAFGIEKAGSERKAVLRLRTSTPRVVGIVLDLEQYVFRLYTDFQLRSVVKEAPISPGHWRPFIKIKQKGNVVVLNPFCVRCSVGVSAEGYQSPEPTVQLDHPMTVGLLNLPLRVVEGDDLGFVKSHVGEGLEEKAVRFCHVAKDKDRKCLGVGLLDFSTEEGMKSIVQICSAGESGVEVVAGDKLWKMVRKVWDQDKMRKRSVVGVKYKAPKVTLPEVSATPQEPTPQEAKKEEEKKSEEEGKKSEEKKEEAPIKKEKETPIKKAEEAPSGKEEAPGKKEEEASGKKEDAPIKKEEAPSKKEEAPSTAKEQKSEEGTKTEESKDQKEIKKDETPQKPAEDATTDPGKVEQKEEASVTLATPATPAPQPQPQVEDAKKVESAPTIPQKKGRISEEQRTALKACIAALTETKVKQYKDGITGVLRGSSPSFTAPIQAVEKDSSGVQAVYLEHSDSMLLVRGPMMKLVQRTHGRFEVPLNCFFNSPTSSTSVISLELKQKDARYLLGTMKWRALGELLYRASAESVLEFVCALDGAIKSHPEVAVVQIPLLYRSAKIAVDYALKALTAELLYRADPDYEDQRDVKELRLFALSPDQDIHHLTSIFASIEETLWSMAQSNEADESVHKLWRDTPSRIHSAFTRLMSFQFGRERVPSSVALAEAGLLRIDTNSLVHFEEPRLSLEQEIYQLTNKHSMEELWEELEKQLPESKLLAGAITANVPLAVALNNFAPSISSSSQLSGVSSISVAPKKPLLLCSSAEGDVEVWSCKLTLSRLAQCNMKGSAKQIWESYGSSAIATSEDVPVLAGPESEETLGLESMFGEVQDYDTGEVSAQMLAKTSESSKEIVSAMNPMLLLNDLLNSCTSPLSVAAVVVDKGGNQYLRVRQFGYFAKFLNQILTQSDGMWVTPFDDGCFHANDKQNAMRAVFWATVEKAFALRSAFSGEVFGLISEVDCPLEKGEVVAAYATPIVGSPEFCVRLFVRSSETDELVLKQCQLSLSSKSLSLVKTTCLGYKGARVRVVLSTELAVIIAETKLACHRLDGFEPVCEIPVEKLDSLDQVHVQSSILMVQHKDTVDLYSVKKEEGEKEEKAVQAVGVLTKDIEPHELAATDLAAYGNAEGTIAIGARGKSNVSSIHCSTMPNEMGEETKNTWTVLAKSRLAEHEFEVEMNEEKEVENLEVQLSFTKQGLSLGEVEAANKGLEAEEKKPEPERKRLADASDPHLPLVVVWHKGASHNHTVSLSKLFSFDNKEFKSNYPQPEFIFAHQHYKQLLGSSKFVVKKCVVRSSISSGNKCHPIGSGIIYVANHMTAFKHASHNFVKESEYAEWLEKRRQCKLELQPHEPAGFFQMGDGNELTFSLNVERPCRYVYLKPTAFRSKPSEIKQFSSYPMSIEYFGVVGTLIESGGQSTEAWRHTLEIDHAKFLTTAELEICAWSEKAKKWEPLTSIRQIPLQELELPSKSLQLIDREQAKQGQVARYRLVYEEKELHKAITNRYILRVKQGDTKGDWQFNSISLKIFASKKVEQQGELFKHISSTYLWKCMNEPELFGRVNKTLCELVCMPERDHHDRIKTISLIRKIMEVGTEQLSLVKRHVDFERFIRTNVYDEHTSSYGLKFLQMFNHFPDFMPFLSSFAEKELSCIHKVMLRPAGINGFKAILALVIPKQPEQYLHQLIGKIYEISTKYIESVLSEEHIFLRTRLGVTSYPLSPFAWIAPSTGKREERVIQSFGDRRKKPSNVKCGFIHTASSCRFLLDCGQLHDLTHAVLYFKKDASNMSVRFSVAIHAVTEPEMEQVRVFEYEYPEHMWERLTSAAYSQENNKFDEKDELDSLIISLGSFHCRYAVIDLHLKRGYEAVIEGKSLNTQEYLKDGVIAELYGVPLNKPGTESPTIDAFLAIEEHQRVPKRIGHSASYEKVQSSNCFVELYQPKVSQQEEKVDVKQRKGEENVGVQLSNMQKQLQKEIRKYKDGQASQEGILDIVAQIEGMQRIQCQEMSKEVVEGNQCVEYLVQICIELCTIVMDIVGKSPQLLGILKKQTACNVVTLIKVLFRDFIVFNAGDPREEMTLFIQNVLLQETTDAEWVKLMLEIVEDFLSKSHAFYSQKALIDCLEKFNIPEGELLSYLAKKLKLKERLVMRPRLEERKRSSSMDKLEKEIFPELASTLVLAIKSLRKLQIEDVDAVVHRGITCNYCGNNKPIVGMRFKCGHCANVNICSKSHCIKKHSDEQKDHVLICIPKPLPYSPTKVAESVQYKVLLPPMKLLHSSKVHEGIECDNCGAKGFEGTRYLCANCDYFNLCEKCYLQEKYSHTKTHVFLRLPEPLVQSETATPKALVAHLDPELYPLQKAQPQEPLMVPELKRSLSMLAERKVEYERLDIDETLQVAYRILIWICHTEVMDRKNKAVALKLSADLLCMLLKLSSVDTVCGVVQEDTQLEHIISSFMSIEDDKTVRSALVKLIAGLKNVSIKTMNAEEVKEMPASERGEYLVKVEKTLNIRSYLSTCLHQILKSLIDNAPKGKAAELIDIDSLALLLDSYISILDSIAITKELLKKYKVIKDEEEEIVVPELQRSVSLPISHAPVVKKSKVTKPSMQLAFGLIALLESFSPLAMGSMYGTMWEIVLKILAKINMKKVIEARLFERLMASFFHSSIQIQETIYRQLLSISEKMMQFPNMSTLIINLIRSTLESAVNTPREEMAFYICRGWLCILVKGTISKAVEKEGKKEEQEEKKEDVFAKLDNNDLLDLLSFASAFLMNNLNYGNYSGIIGGKYKVMYRAMLVSRMFQIVSKAKSKDGSKLAIEELIQSSKNTKLFSSFNQLLVWLFLNFIEDDTSGKIMKLVSRTSKNVLGLFEYVGANEPLCKSLLATIQEIVIAGDRNMLKRVELGELRVTLAVELNQRFNKLLKKMMKLIMSSTTIATYFAFELKGFEFLFNRLGIRSEREIEAEGSKVLALESDLMEGISDAIQSPQESSDKAEVVDAKGKKPQFTPSLLMDEDYAKDMNLTECTGETNLSSLHHINWCTYKGGQRSKIYTKQFKTGNIHELAMAFELKKLIEIKEIQLAFINFWGMDNFEHLDVSSVVLEVAIAKGSYSYLCTLEKATDKSLEVHGVTVFGRNLSTFDEAISKSDPVGYKLNSLKNARAKYIRFIIRTGIKVSFTGTQASKSGKQKALGVNYFSIIGYDSSGISQVQTYLSQKNQKMAYKLLNMFQMKTFRGCLKEFAMNPAIINQLKVNFHTLAMLMTPDKPTIEPFLIALCTHNGELGKWILHELIRSRESKGSALFMVQICLSNLDKLEESQDLVLSFIVKELEQLEHKRTEQVEAPKSLSQFILHYVSLLYLVSPLLKRDVELKVREEDLLLVLRHCTMHWDVVDVRETLIKLFLVLLKPPQRVISKIDAQAFAAKHLLVPKDQRSLFLASYLTIFDQAIGKKLLEVVPLEFTMQNEQAAVDQLAIILNLTLDAELKRALAEKRLPLIVYEKMKNPAEKTTYMYPMSQNLMLLCDELIKQGVLGYPDNEAKLAEAMIQDLDVMKSVEEKEALSKVILNLMKAEKSVPVCFYNFDAECEQWKSLAADDTLRKGKKKTFFLDTPLLLQKHKELLMNNLRERIGIESEADRLFGANWKLVFKEIGSPPQNSAEKFKAFFEAVSSKGPFIVFMSGMSEGKRAVVGGFTMTSFPQKPSSFQNGQTLEIKSSPESLFFYYSENKLHHFEIRNKGENFGYIYIDYANCGACVLGNYFLSFSYSYSYSNSIGSLSSLKCTDSNVTYLPYNFIVDSIEVWACEQDAAVGMETSEKDSVAPLTKVTAAEHTWYSAKSPYQCFRANAVFSVPAHITIKELSECVIGKSGTKMKLRYSGALLDEQLVVGAVFGDNQKDLINGIMDVEFEVDKDSKEIIAGVGYKPENAILTHFEKLGGYLSLIDAAKSSLAKWKNTKLSMMFQLYLEELLQFSKLADFFKSLLSNKRSKTFLFEIMAGTPDKDTSGKSKKEVEAKEKKWESEYNSAVTYCYTIISQLFLDPNNLEIRMQASKSDFIPLILTRLEKLTGEKPRKFEEEVQLKKEISVHEKTEAAVESPTKKKARKGVGYTTGIGEIWDVDKYLKSKKAKNNQIIALINIITNFISCDRWEPDDEFIDAMCESALLPSLESAMASGSLLEMAKENDLIQSYLELINKFREKEKLAKLLIEIDPHYVPPQREPLYKVMKNLNEISNIFLKCMEKEVELKPENEVPKLLAVEIHNCFKKVMRVVDKLLQERKGEDMKNILSLPLAQAYKVLLRDLRFGYMNMRDEKNKYKHFYHSHAEQEKTASQGKLIRLAQELADLSNALPEEYTNAIYIRVDDQRIDYMKALVMGASGTPYAHGAYEYDIYCPSNYPNESPKMNLCTTGNNAVRFNPNLYHDGKVCLSLLGTWRGTATENWDPKVSTILQVLMSLQAIVMSEEVYFNEPGFEGEIGKPEGEKKNEAYSNIVRYANMKFAMIGQVKNPPKGFESVVKRHFYIKKEEIMKEAYKWLEFAEKHEAAYDGLVYDHNSEWCNKFKQSKTKYKEMLLDLVKELETTLNSIEPPQELIEETGGDLSKLKTKTLSTMAFTGGESIEGVDVGEETAEDLVKRVKEKENKLNISDAGVMDRWSRYIGAVGMEAVQKQTETVVFLSGAGGLGIEIAKNMVLSGCKEFVIHDSKVTTKEDLASQFFLRESDIGESRAKACRNRLQELNYYVKVTAVTEALPATEEELGTKQFGKYAVVVLTECDYKTQLVFDAFCRKNKVCLIIAEVRGTVCKVVNDFGEKFEVIDVDGEVPKECMIKSVTNEERGVVTTITGQRHGFTNGELVVIKEVEGMELEEKKEKEKEIQVGEVKKEAATSINETVHAVEYIDAFRFRIGNTKEYTKYVRNGVARQVKMGKTLDFMGLAEVYSSGEVPIDLNLREIDFAKMGNIGVSHIAFEALDAFGVEHGRLPEEWNLPDAEALVAFAKDIALKRKKELNDAEIDFVMKFACTARAAFSPLCAFLGGVVAQEIVKAITNKYSPIHQVMYFDCQDVLPSINFKDFENSRKSLGLAKSGDRYDHVRAILGEEAWKRMADYKLFLIGVGAIGCELLKNYAMLGIGSGSGKLLITDPDVIEVSNLSRQFLFKEKHVRKPKSTTAAASVIQMNPSIKNKIVARMDKVQESTAYIFTDEFFGELNIVTNALDNVQARRYIDSRCVSNKVPLLESGTLGAKGHVQVVIPYKTESYSSLNDPEESTEIPVCTLKMFPEEIVHCIEWARDKFSKLFTQKPKVLQKYLDIGDMPPPSPEEIKSLQDAVKILNKKPTCFEDCVRWARLKFQKYFVNDIRQLMHVYPPETRTKEGQQFWTLPKRPPHETKFDPANPVHSHFIMALSSLYAKVWGMEVPNDIRQPEVRMKYAKFAAEISVPEYKLDDKKAKAIQAEVEKAEVPKEGKEEKEEKKMSLIAEEENMPQDQLMDKLLDELDVRLGDMAAENKTVLAEEFEKDSDLNFHIDFIYSMANCRAECYKIPGNSWIDTKLKAGNIIPALASTTAVVAALQTLELVKLGRGVGIETQRNSYVNLALPYFELTEPGAPPKIELTPELKVTLWDRWEVKAEKGYDTTFAELVELLKVQYKLEPKDFFKGSKPLYMEAVMSVPAKAGEKAKTMKSKLEDALDLDGGEAYVDLTVTFTRPGETKLLEGVPPVRVTFK